MRLARQVVRSAAILCLAVVVPLAQAALPDFTPLAENQSKAVVNISASAKSKGRTMPNQQEVPEIFRRFFGEEFGSQAPRDRQSFGSGFIISNDGYVLTNNHVVQGADKVLVRLADRREIEAKVIGTDERSDVALLKIEATDLPAAMTMGNPDLLKVGEWVMAIGSPFGFDYSVTAGIVSAKSRALPNESYVPFIQTDVAINPGNSGGPLLNMNGEVIGINSHIYSRSGGFMGLSFAIPIDVAMEVVEQLKTDGHVARGYLGVVTQDITRDLAEAYGLPKPAGALVSKVLPGTPAEKAGLKDGDVITRFNDKDIGLSSELPQLIGRAKVGDKLPLEVVRDGKIKVLAFEVAPLPEDEDVAAAKVKSDKPDINRLGISIRDLNPQEKAQLKLEGGVVVLQVVEGAGADAGLRPGDVIVALNRKPLATVQQFVETAKALPAGKAVPMSVSRRGQPLILPLRLEAAEPAAKDKK